MHITINRAELLAAVKRASTIAPADSPLDVLKGVLLEADSADGMLAVTSTNLEVSLAEKLPCTVHEDGALVFTAKTLAEMLQRLPEETAELCRRENRGRMTLTSGSAGYSVDVWDMGAFPKPDLPFPEDTVKVSGVPSMAQHTVFATAQDQSKPLLRCVNLMFTSTGLRAAGSNGSCIVTAKGDDQSTGDISLLIPASSLGKLAGMCGNEDVFRVGTTGKSIVFFKENFLFSSRLMDGGYIDTDSLLKTITNSFTVLTDIKEMRRAILGHVRRSGWAGAAELSGSTAAISLLRRSWQRLRRYRGDRADRHTYGRILVQRTTAHILPESAWRYDHPWHRARRNVDHQHTGRLLPAKCHARAGCEKESNQGG